MKQGKPFPIAADEKAEPQEASLLEVARDNLAFFFEEHRQLLLSLLSGAAMGWAAFSACSSFHTLLTPWAVPIAIAITILAAVELWSASALAMLVCTVQMLQVHSQLGWVTAALSLVFLMLCLFGHGRASLVLITPWLSAAGGAVIIPLGFGVVLDKRGGWLWSLLAFAWCTLHAFLFGDPRLGIARNTQFLDKLMDLSATHPKGFSATWLNTVATEFRVDLIVQGFTDFIAANPPRWTSLMIQAILWITAAYLMGSLYRKKRMVDKAALEYLEKVTGATSAKIAEPMYRKLPGALAAGAVLMALSYIVLAQIFDSIRYWVSDALLDFVMAGALLVPLYVIYEGRPEMGKKAKARRLARREGLLQKRPPRPTPVPGSGRPAGAVGTSNISTEMLHKEVKGAPKLPRGDLERPTPSRPSTGGVGRRRTPAPAALWQVGDKIDNQYTVLREHKGGMGIVYEVVDEFSGKKYAVKSLRDDFLQSPEAIERFGIEAKTWINLDYHDHIVQAMMFRVVDGRPLLFLEFVEGTDLGRLLEQRGAVSVAEALDWAKQIGQGMAYAHGKEVGAGRTGVVHRDLKPANLLLTRQGSIKITDFGLVKVVDTATHLTRQQTGLGTLAYMSPEQLEDARNVDKRADIYSFGAVLYELLTGTPPATGESVANLTTSILTQMARAPSHKNPAVPPPLDQIVLRCLEKDRNRRYNDFTEILAELAQIPITPEMRAAAAQASSQPWATPSSVPATPTPPGVTTRPGSSGTVTTSVEAIVFIDMAGSTAMGSTYGDDFVLQMKEQLANMVQIEARREKMLFYKGTGDGCILTFPEPENAARAAIGIMQRVSGSNSGKPEGRQLRLRMGIHFGQVNIDSSGDRQGTAVNFAARIEAVKASQRAMSDSETEPPPLKAFDRILISEVVHDELKSKPEFKTRELGYFNFQGIKGLHQVFQLAWR